MKYEVDIREVWLQTYLVEADNPEEAQYLAVRGNGEAIDGRFEYSDTPDAQLDLEFGVREADPVVESPSGWSYRKSQENGDFVDCYGCGRNISDDYPIVNDEEGYAYHEGCNNDND